MNKLTQFIFFVLIISNSSCTFFTPKTTQGDAIDKDIRAQMASLNKKLFKSIMTKDVKTVKSLMSPVLLDSAGTKVDTIVNAMADAFHATDYRVLDEYYTKNSSLTSPTTLISNKGDINYYELKYQARNNEIYTVVLVSKDLPINCCILAIYGKYGDNWKLNILEIGEYDVLGKTAPEYYAAATDKIRKGDTIDAAEMIIIASEIATPGGKYLKYNNTDDMQTFYTATIAEANSNYRFPITVNQLKTAPQIFSIIPQMVNDKDHKGIFPIVKYKSIIKLSNTVALKSENDAMQKIIGGLFTGIDQDKDYIFYRIYNQMPDGKTKVNYYGFVQHLK